MQLDSDVHSRADWIRADSLRSMGASDVRADMTVSRGTL